MPLPFALTAIGIATIRLNQRRFWVTVNAKLGSTVVQQRRISPNSCCFYRLTTLCYCLPCVTMGGHVGLDYRHLTCNIPDSHRTSLLNSSPTELQGLTSTFIPDGALAGFFKTSCARSSKAGQLLSAGPDFDSSASISAAIPKLFCASAACNHFPVLPAPEPPSSQPETSAMEEINNQQRQDTQVRLDMSISPCRRFPEI